MTVVRVPVAAASGVSKCSYKSYRCNPVVQPSALCHQHRLLGITDFLKHVPRTAEIVDAPIND